MIFLGTSDNYKYSHPNFHKDQFSRYFCEQFNNLFFITINCHLLTNYRQHILSALLLFIKLLFVNKFIKIQIVPFQKDMLLLILLDEKI